MGDVGYFAASCWSYGVYGSEIESDGVRGMDGSRLPLASSLGELGLYIV